jgi:hypothetical protein
MKPILFSAPMVRAILEGRKTMTRRVIKSDPTHPHWDGLAPTGWHDGHRPMQHVPYSLGDVLWVRETFQKVLIEEDEPDDVYGYVYKASPETFEDYGVMRDGKEYPLPWRPSIFMPKAACRIFVRVTNVRAERVQNITVEDVIREGLNDVDNEIRNEDPTTHESIRNWNLSWAQFQFQTLWDSLNAKRGFDWDVNPWVWVVEFERVDKVKEG